MPKKRPPNAEATQFVSGERAVECGRKGGMKSAEAKKERKTVKMILDSILEEPINKTAAVQKLATKLGFTGNESVKDLYTIVCLMNSMKKGSIGDLETLVRLLGEDKEGESNSVLEKLDKVIGEIDVIADE